MVKIELLICLIPATFSAYTDATKRHLYDYITIPIFVTGVLFSIYNGTVFNSLITAAVVFGILLIMGLYNGISGGDIKFATALAVWFGFPLILYVILIGAISSVIYGIFHLNRLGILKARLQPFIQEIFIRAYYGEKTMPINSLPENGDTLPEALPFGTFLTLGAWVVFILEIQGFVWPI